jgi:hypothetical protein
MATDAEAPSKRAAPPISAYLSERMRVGRLVEVLEQLPFNSREEGRLVIDRVRERSRSNRPWHLVPHVSGVWLFVF